MRRQSTISMVLFAAALALGSSQPAATAAASADKQAPQELSGAHVLTLTLEQNGQLIDMSFALIELQTEDEELAAELIEGHPQLGLSRDLELQEARLQHGRLTLLFSHPAVEPIEFNGTVSDAGVVGTFEISTDVLMARLEPTDDESLDDVAFTRPTPGHRDLQDAAEIEDPAERAEALTEFAEANAASPLAPRAQVALLRATIEQGAETDAVRAQAEAALQSGAVWGPSFQAQTAGQVVEALLEGEGHAELALEYALAAQQALPDDAPPSAASGVRTALARAYAANGRTEEALQIAQEIRAQDPSSPQAALAQGQILEAIGNNEEALAAYAAATIVSIPGRSPEAEEALARLWEELNGDDEEGLEAYRAEAYAANIPPFEVEPYERPSEAADRVAVVELFTGVQCPPCVAADVAFDALVEAFEPQDVVLLQYHLHIPGPDPLTNPDSVARANYYGAHSTPSTFFSGIAAAGGGGGLAGAAPKYEQYRGLLEPILEESSPIEIELSASREDATIRIEASVRGVDEPSEDLRLRFALVEDHVNYAGRNGVRVHHSVVRALPGGEDGFAIDDAETTADAEVDLDELRAALDQYLADNRFPESDRPLELENLAVVALVQNDETKEILQATYVPVEE